MRLRLVHDGVNVVERGTRQLELTAGLERDGRVISFERDERSTFGFADRLPAEAARELAENAHDALIAVVREGRAARGEDAELLGLGADAPRSWRFHGVVKRQKQVFVRKRHVSRPSLLRHPASTRQRFRPRTDPGRARTLSWGSP